MIDADALSVMGDPGRPPGLSGPKAGLPARGRILPADLHIAGSELVPRVFRLWHEGLVPA